MRKLLVLLFICSFSAFGESPQRSVELLYQHYKDNQAGVIFDASGKDQVISSRLMKEVAEDQKLTAEGDVGYLNYDPICNCQDYDNLVLEQVDIVPHDGQHVDAIVRFRPFSDGPETVTQTLSLVDENGRWLIDDIVNETQSLYQGIKEYNRERQQEALSDKGDDKHVTSSPSSQPSP
ncbi:YbjP/YqhG family protein [Escherichia coli]|nr:YbjP/YqhG family protein [Escherichia coli]